MDEKEERLPRRGLDGKRVARHAFVLVLCCCLFTVYQIVRRPRFQLTFEMSASAPAGSLVRLGFDTGVGFNDSDSRVDSLRSQSLNSFQTFRFELPRRRNIIGLQLVPRSTPGSVTIRNVAIRGRYGAIVALPVSGVVPLAEIRDRVEDTRHNQVTFTTVPGSGHPQLTIRLAEPLLYRRLLAMDRRGPIIVGNAILFGFAFFFFLHGDLVLRWSNALKRCLQAAKVRFPQSSGHILPVMACFVLCSIAITTYRLVLAPPVQLTLEMSSTIPSVAQLFYDLGTGYTEKLSQAAAVVPGSQFQKLSFDLPKRRILNFRFDPLTSAGAIKVRHVAIKGPHGPLIQIASSDVKVYNQIQAREEHGDTVSFVTIPGANDPGLTIDLHKDLAADSLSAAETRRSIALDHLLLLLFAVVYIVFRQQLVYTWALVCTSAGVVNRPVERLARRISDPDFIEFHPVALWFYAVCVAFFFLGVLADLNGSSVGMYSSSFGAAEKPLAGAPRAIRVDEWAYATPTILNQTLRVQPFAAEHSFLGDHWVALGANVPVWHVATLFRPQFWSFFLLPVDYAYSVYWQFKFLILLTGTFSLLLLLTRSTLWGIAGSLWYFFSPGTQWTYSWPSALPEMVGSMCLLVVLSCYLTIGRNRIALILASMAWASCAINFTLCGYLPHEVPVFWFGVFCFASWVFAKQNLILRPDAFGYRAIAIGTVLVTVATVGLIVSTELHTAIIATKSTAYPGARDLSGGNVGIQLLTSHFLPWAQTENHFPPIFVNICESSGFLWLAPLTLFLTGKLMLSKFQKFALAALWCLFTIVLLWLLLPIPAHIGRVLAFNQTAGTRVLPALGLANVFIVAVCMSGVRPDKPALRNILKIATLARMCGTFLVVCTIVVLTNQTIANYFSWGQVFFAVIFLTLVAVFLLEQWSIPLAIALVVPQALFFWDVNPIQRGLGVFTDSPLYRLVHRHTELLNGRWIVYSDSHASSGYLAALGCNVYTGSRYLPDIDHFPDFAAAGLSLKAFDRDGMLLAHALPHGYKAWTWVPVNFGVIWSVSPSDPILKKLGITYFAFDKKPTDVIASQLTPLSNEPVSNLWIYKLAPESAFESSRVIK